ncbi:hypothetical protein KAR91_26265 [Candidatus Pacearchaeota archaeon]|nr:hypothetical protein [Candidatus Pacearchaeota archaeon]
MTQQQLLAKAQEYEAKSYKFAEMAIDPQYCKVAQKGIESRAESVAQMAALHYCAANNMKTLGCDSMLATTMAIKQVRYE